MQEQISGQMRNKYIHPILHAQHTNVWKRGLRFADSGEVQSPSTPRQRILKLKQLTVEFMDIEAENIQV